MNIRLICVGKLKEQSIKSACAEYIKRLTWYYKLEIIEVADESIPETFSEKQVLAALEKEAERIKNVIKPGIKIALAIDGDAHDSIGFAKYMKTIEQFGTANIIIGGSNGLAKSIVDTCDKKLSLSNLTFPHNIARMLILEQLYRAARINAGEPYHK